MPATHLPARRAARVLLAIPWLGIPAWALATRFDAIANGHVVYPVLLAASALIGVVLLLRSRRVEPTPHGVARRLVAWTAGLLVTALAAVVLVFGRPHAATPVALAAMSTSAGVSVAQDATKVTLTPDHPSAVGVVFHPGARVDARAYVPILRRLAERGHPVVIAKQPLGVSLLAQGTAERAMKDDPQVGHWVVAGHSLGGVAAARTAAQGDPRIVGLVFWASYASASTSTDVVPILSVYGTNDGLIPPAEAVARRDQMPPDARFVPVEGAVHTSFADYGTQRDDGVESVPHEVAQQQIADVTLEFIDGLHP